MRPAPLPSGPYAVLMRRPAQRAAMDDDTLASLIMTFTLLGVTWHAWRIGNERRDVALLGAFAAGCALLTGASLLV